MPSCFSRAVHLRLEDLADVDLGDAQVAVRVALDARRGSARSSGRYVEHDALGDHRDAVAAAVAQPLDDRARRACRRSSCSRIGGGELLGDQRQRRARRLADAEREVAGLPAHRDHEVPARRRLGVDHQVLDDLDAVVARGLEPERVDVRRQIEIVVDRLRHVDDADAARRRAPRASSPRTPCRRRRS